MVNDAASFQRLFFQKRKEREINSHNDDDGDDGDHDDEEGEDDLPLPTLSWSIQHYRCTYS